MAEKVPLSRWDLVLQVFPAIGGISSPRLKKKRHLDRYRHGHGILGLTRLPTRQHLASTRSILLYYATYPPCIIVRIHTALLPMHAITSSCSSSPSHPCRSSIATSLRPDSNSIILAGPPPARSQHPNNRRGSQQTCSLSKPVATCRNVHHLTSSTSTRLPLAYLLCLHEHIFIIGIILSFVSSTIAT